MACILPPCRATHSYPPVVVRDSGHWGLPAQTCIWLAPASVGSVIYPARPLYSLGTHLLDVDKSQWVDVASPTCVADIRRQQGAGLE